MQPQQNSQLGTLNHELWPLLVVTGLMVLLLWIRNKERTSITALLGITPRPALIVLGAPALILMLLSIAMLRPFFGAEDLDFEGSKNNIFLVLDASNSMLASDASPVSGSMTRFELARRKLRDLVELLTEPKQSQTNNRGLSRNRVALVLFAGRSQIICPLTSDAEIISSIAKSIDRNLVKVGGSSINDALEKISKSVKSAALSNADVILLSDGEDDRLDFIDVRRIVSEQNIKIITLGFGSDSGSVIQLPNGNLVRDRSGEVVRSRLDIDNMRRLAEIGKGSYVGAALDDSDVRQIADLLRPNQVTPESQYQLTVYAEWGPALTRICLALIVSAFLLGKRELVLPLLLLASLASAFPRSVLAQANNGADQAGSTSAQAPLLDLFNAWSAYRRGDYATAKLAFEHHNRLSGSANLKVLEALAAAQYKTGDYKAAEKSYAALFEAAPSGRLKYKALYNGGNASLLQGNYDQAISRYEQALAIKPGDKPSLHNLDVAKYLQSLRQSSSSLSTSSSQNEASRFSQPQASAGMSASSASAQEGSLNSAGSEAASSAGEEQQSAPGEQFPNSQQQSQSAGGKEQMQQQGSQGQSSGQNSQGTEISQGTQHSEADSSLDRNNIDYDNNGASSSEEGWGDFLRFGPSPTHDPQALSEQERESWLNALDDGMFLPRANQLQRREQDPRTW